jgi:hypothetical protein
MTRDFVLCRTPANHLNLAQCQLPVMLLSGVPGATLHVHGVLTIHPLINKLTTICYAETAKYILRYTIHIHYVLPGCRALITERASYSVGVDPRGSNKIQQQPGQLVYRSRLLFCACEVSWCIIAQTWQLCSNRTENIPTDVQYRRAHGAMNTSTD